MRSAATPSKPCTCPAPLCPTSTMSTCSRKRPERLKLQLSSSKSAKKVSSSPAPYCNTGQTRHYCNTGPTKRVAGLLRHIDTLRSVWPEKKGRTRLLRPAVGRRGMAPCGGEECTPSASPSSNGSPSSTRASRFRRRFSSIAEDEDEALPTVTGVRKNSLFRHGGRRDNRIRQLQAAKDDAETEMFLNVWRQQRLLPPYGSRVHGRRLRQWCWFLMVLALYEVVYIPLQLAFQEPRGLDGALQLPALQLAIQYMIDVCFLFDILVRFRTLYVSGPHEGNELGTAHTDAHSSLSSWHGPNGHPHKPLTMAHTPASHHVLHRLQTPHTSPTSVRLSW